MDFVVTVTKKDNNYIAEYDENQKLNEGDQVIFKCDKGTFPDKNEADYVISRVMLDLEILKERSQ